MELKKLNIGCKYEHIKANLKHIETIYKCFSLKKKKSIFLSVFESLAATLQTSHRVTPVVCGPNQAIYDIHFLCVAAVSMAIREVVVVVAVGGMGFT